MSGQDIFELLKARKRRKEKMRTTRILMMVGGLTVVIVFLAVWIGVAILGRDSSSAPVQTQAIVSQPANGNIVPCEPPESKRCQEAALQGDGKIATPADFDYVAWLRDYDIGQSSGTSGPSFLETFGLVVFVSLILAVLVAAATPWTLRQTIPVAIGLATTAMVIMNWWILFVVVAILVLIIIGETIARARKLLPAGAKTGVTFLIVWEIIQTLGGVGTIGEIIQRFRTPQQAQTPPPQNP